MDNKQIAELKKFINTLADSKIGPLIDLKKLCQSGIYKIAVPMATAHAANHKDYTYLKKIFGIIDGSPYERDFISTLRITINFVINETKPRKLKHATLEQVIQAARPSSPSPTNPSKIKPIAAKSPATKRAEVRNEKRRVSHALMDSRLMLPGSYGTGKRR